MNRFFKLYKFLFEDDKYKNIGLNSKVAYCVYRDLIQQNRNVKKDKEGKVYRVTIATGIGTVNIYEGE